MAAQRFDQASYWIKRHQNLKNDPRSVGNAGASLEDNFKGEADLKIAVNSVAGILAGRNSSVLDLGCGYGRIANEFISRGFSYTGIDISAEAIEQARSTVPQGTFLQKNLVNWTTKRRFDVVCVLYVFVHFVDDDEWLAVLEATMPRVRARGVLFFADLFPAEKTVYGPHVVCRPIADYEKVLAKHQFKLDAELTRKAVEANPQSPYPRQFRFARR